MDKTFDDFGVDTSEVGKAKGAQLKELGISSYDKSPKNAAPVLSEVDANGSSLDTANNIDQTGASRARARIEILEADLQRKAEDARKQLEAAKREADRQKRIADAQVAKANRLNQERIDRALREAQLALDRNKNIPRKTLDDVNDPAIREKLINAIAAQELNKRLEDEKKKTELTLSQLLQMAAVTMQAATAMNSVEGTSPAQNSQTFDPTKAVAPKAALAGRSPASLGDKKNTISAKSDEPDQAAEGETSKKELSAKDKETLAKIKAEVEAAQKRKKIQALRQKLKLRERANAQGKGAVDTDELFGGSLNQDMETAEASDQIEEAAAKSSGMSASSVYQAVKEGFSLAGSDTDREVGQIVSEAERDLSSEDMSAGVLGRESPSLFARVHSVHQACQRQKCVLANK